MGPNKGKATSRKDGIRKGKNLRKKKDTLDKTMVSFSRQKGIVVHAKNNPNYQIGRIDWFGFMGMEFGFMCTKNWIRFEELEQVYFKMKEIKDDIH